MLPWLRITKGIALQTLNQVVDLTKFTRDADALWTVGLTLATLNAVIWLTVARHDTIQRDEVLTAVLAVFRIACTVWQRTLVLTLIIMYEDGGDIDAVWTRHTILTVVTGDILQTHDALSNVLVE